MPRPFASLYVHRTCILQVVFFLNSCTIIRDRSECSNVDHESSLRSENKVKQGCVSNNYWHAWQNRKAEGGRDKRGDRHRPGAAFEGNRLPSTVRKSERECGVANRWTMTAKTVRFDCNPHHTCIYVDSAYIHKHVRACTCICVGASHCHIERQQEFFRLFLFRGNFVCFAAFLSLSSLFSLYVCGCTGTFHRLTLTGGMRGIIG